MYRFLIILLLLSPQARAQQGVAPAIAAIEARLNGFDSVQAPSITVRGATAGFGPYRGRAYVDTAHHLQTYVLYGANGQALYLYCIDERLGKISMNGAAYYRLPFAFVDHDGRIDAAQQSALCVAEELVRPLTLLLHD